MQHEYRHHSSTPSVADQHYHEPSLLYVLCTSSAIMQDIVLHVRFMYVTCLQHVTCIHHLSWPVRGFVLNLAEFLVNSLATHIELVQTVWTGVSES